MKRTAKVTLLFVVFVDLIGQGLVFPIINSLIMDPASGFLPQHVSSAQRHVDYGLVIGIFFLAWFLGVVYVAKLSDSIGRKNALLICLGGALAGYAITIVSLLVFSDLLPRSVLYCLRQAEVGLRHVDPTGSRQAPRLLSRLRSELEFGTVEELLASGLGERLEQVEHEILRVIASMSAEFFLEPLQHGVHTVRLGALDSEGERT